MDKNIDQVLKRRYDLSEMFDAENEGKMSGALAAFGSNASKLHFSEAFSFLAINNLQCKCILT